MAQGDFESAKAFLQRKEGDTSVYEHLTELVLKLVTEQPDDAVRSFERISALVKQGTYRMEPQEAAQAGAGPAAGGEAEDDERQAAAAARVAAMAKLLRARGGEDENGEEEEVGEVGEGIQNFSEMAQQLEWANAGFGMEESFRLHLALRELSAKTSGRNMRVWGKLLGTGGDYIVAEGEVDDDGEGEDAEEAVDALGNTIEPAGEGANKLSYWVCRFPGDEWVKLPRVTPHQVIVARQIRRYLTGDLDAPVGGHPPFPGTERNLIRALVAIISAETVIHPAGYYRRADEDDEANRDLEEVPADEFEAGGELASADGWAHHVLPLNPIGRTAPNPKEDEGEEEEEPEEGMLTQPLASAGEDTRPGADGEDEPLWAVRGCPVSGIPSEEPAVVAVKNLRWPGAVAVGFGRRFANFYSGYGVPAADAAASTYQPRLPAAVPGEFTVAGFNAAAAEDGAVFAEQDEVREDPDAGKGDGEEGEEDEEDD